MTRILVAHSFYRLPGGEDRYVAQQLELLGRTHRVELLGRRNTELRPGVSAAARMALSRRQRREVDDAVERFRPDVIHLHNAYPSLGPAVHLSAQAHRVPLVMTVHNFRLRCPNGYMFTEGKACRRCESGMYAHAVLHRCFPSKAQAASYAAALWLHRFVLRLGSKVDLFITPSEFVAARMLEWGIDHERVRVVRNFTPLGPTSSGSGEYGMYLGRLSGEKGVDVLLRALHDAGDPPFRIVGDGPLSAALTELAGTLGLGNTVFTGQIDPTEVRNVVAAARYLVLPSVWDENAPLAALEAMAAGLPLLVTRTGGLPELVRNGEGLMAEPGDARALAAHIETLVTDEASRRSLGRRALERAREEFSPEHHLARLEAAYEGVLRKRRRAT